MHHDMNGTAAIAAIFDVVLIIAADIQSDVGRVAAKGAEDGFIKELHRILLIGLVSLLQCRTTSPLRRALHSAMLRGVLSGCKAALINQRQVIGLTTSAGQVATRNPAQHRR